MMRTLHFFLLVFPCLVLAPPARAQLDVAQGRSSLRGIRAFSVVLDVEAESPLSNHEAFDLARPLIERLRAAGLPVVRQGPDIPYLYVHVNALAMERGLVPFSVSLQFLQPVLLARDRITAVTGATWESGTVGLVSSDNLGWIAEATFELTDEFIADFRTADR